LIFGPLQIEGRIDQNPEISAQITLWDQGGSEVIRGNLLVLPIDNSLLYVEPLYLRAENGQIPELKRVILASGDRIVMEETLAEALLALFDEDTGDVLTEASERMTAAEEDVVAESEQPAAAGEEAASTEAAPESGSELSDSNVAELAQMASEHYEAAERALRAGDWATYGEELDKLEQILNTLVELTENQ
jgi:uncharacterized membrane protein (UPF0182 family)